MNWEKSHSWPITFKLYNLVQSQAGFIFQETGETGKEVWVFNIMFGKDIIIGDVSRTK